MAGPGHGYSPQRLLYLGCCTRVLAVMEANVSGEAVPTAHIFMLQEKNSEGLLGGGSRGPKQL